MEKAETTLLQEGGEFKQNKFQQSHVLTKTTFIVGIISLGFVGISLGIMNSITRVAVFVMDGLIIAIAISGSIIGGFSIKKERNVFGIIGFIFSLLVMVFLIVGLIIFGTAGWG